jgi:hypothetical protein
VFEIALVLAIVGGALFFLLRHFVRNVRGTDACSGCGCASQGCPLGEPPDRLTRGDHAGAVRVSAAVPGDSEDHHASVR